MNKTLLTIAIPTWNRASSLDKALKILLRQVNQYPDLIEVVISDNNSTDNTSEIVNTYIDKYTNINIVYNKQKENTGIYGNFTKCREMSSGKFLWILSDDDFITNNLIKVILNELDNQSSIQHIFLADWNVNEKPINVHLLNKVEAINEIQERLTLVSANIFLNNKASDLHISEIGAESDFIWLFWLFNSMTSDEGFCIIYGTSINIDNSKTKNYNVFKAFVLDIKKALDYALETNIFTEKQITAICNGVLRNIIFSKFNQYIINSSKKEVKHVYELLFQHFKNYHNFILIWLLYKSPNQLKFIIIVIRKLYKYFLLYFSNRKVNYRWS